MCLYGRASSRDKGEVNTFGMKQTEARCAYMAEPAPDVKGKLNPGVPAYMAEPGQQSGGVVAIRNQVCLYGRAGFDGEWDSGNLKPGVPIWQSRF